jgi:hypothetical protein
VKGSVTVARAGSKVRVELFAKPGALGKKGSKLVKVGSATKSAPAGPASFSVALNSAAKSVLRRKGRLALSVKVTVTPSSGTPFTTTLAVTVKR